MKGIFVAGLVVVLALTGFASGYLARRRTTAGLNAEAELRRNSPPLVNSARVGRAPSRTEVLLPGTITPITEAYVFARAAGYLKRRYVDIGDKVRAGQLLAEIDAPDLDQQVTQAEAAVAQAEGQLGQSEATLQQLIATRDLANLTWKRYQVLTASGAVSRQDGDMQSTASKTAEANVTAGEKNVKAAQEFVRASKATLQRLVTLQGYERITSPFAGVVTSRSVDVGALISTTGSSQGPLGSTAAPADVARGGDVFRVAEISRLRILISVPQSQSPGITVGQAADVTVQEFQNRVFPGKVTRTSNSLDAGSRTLLTEVQVANPTGILLPGMYTMVRFFTDRSDPPLLVPGAALIVQADGTRVAVLQPVPGGKPEGVRRVRFQTVEAGRDNGINLEILRGLQGDEDVAVDPSDAVREGMLVMPVSAVSGKAKQ
ncbi:efflux RND transporter periplasmic adaptor subunit [Paludibaculum fermentans]|uniref:efflux RND transporter periplasmic adaptor subunit n=1 Tax=Paludibaculum fermentans TaxID=1473598 RepID=UPI003EBDE7ED